METNRKNNQVPKKPTSETFKELTGKNISVVDTNILIEDPGSIIELRKGGNLLVIPLVDIHELDKLKNDPRIGHEVREAIREINILQEAEEPTLIIESGMNFSGLNFDRSKPDHQIIATLNYIYDHFLKGHDPYKGYDKVKMITNDLGVKILARSINKKRQIVVESYNKTRTKIEKKDLEIPMIEVQKAIVAGDWRKHFTFPVNGLGKKIPDGSPFIGYSNKRNAKKGEFIAIRRGDVFEIINPDIEACGIKSKMSKEATRPNWEQAAALYYVMNPDFDCVFLQGGAGSGKTLISMAAALAQKGQNQYKKIMIFRVPEPLDRKKTLGLLPGDAGAKIGLYLRPIAQALVKLIKNSRSLMKIEREELELTPELKNVGKKKNIQQPAQQQKKPTNLEVHADEIFEKYGIEIAILEYIRGENLDEAFILVDDAQNLSLHEMKSMLTRVGENSKIIFTGDLNQIDSPYLDQNSAGLAHAIKKMGSDPRIAVVTMTQTLRSRVASIAENSL